MSKRKSEQAYRKRLTRKEKEALAELEKERERILDLLSLTPSCQTLISELNILDIKIITITKEPIIDY